MEARQEDQVEGDASYREEDAEAKDPVAGPTRAHLDVRGCEVETRKIFHWMHEYNIAQDALYAPSPVACRCPRSASISSLYWLYPATPSAVNCRTISGRGAPAPSSPTNLRDYPPGLLGAIVQAVSRIQNCKTDIVCLRLDSCSILRVSEAISQLPTFQCTTNRWQDPGLLPHRRTTTIAPEPWDSRCRYYLAGSFFRAQMGLYGCGMLSTRT
ncbi:hypothetical protein BU25DRAFT_70679 [Macroventuria anomochaeta]|uniref:Uncharacterized protein n=1 Tax=Macroventuria anomochaeta TaxID=301207 RepID=A0ACB6RZ54_9PLEO|nr:uncharacterized protein BU25DRAFT_70679 [Macroventuria anomochaeta]KAF2627191.1 hypothetical protein BU25DRAFT_70679 [Macroventuria anomochaeta]